MAQALINGIDGDSGRPSFVEDTSFHKRGGGGGGSREGGEGGGRFLEKTRCCCRGGNSRSLLLISLVLVAFLFNSASGLSCVQCISMTDSGCTKGGGTPKQCSGPHANSAFCLKSVGTAVSGKGHFVMRSCSDAPITNCTRKHEYGDMYTVCHYPCAESGCNTASGRHLGLARMSHDWLTQAILLIVWSSGIWTVTAIVLHKRGHQLICL